jgi:teichuronic acid exporter
MSATTVTIPATPAVRLGALAGNLGWLACGEALSKVITLAAFAYLARTLEPRAFGQLEIGLAFVLVTSLVIEGGFGVWGAREIANDPARTPRVTRDVVSWRVAVMLACVAVAAAGIQAFAPIEIKPLLLGFSLCLLPTPYLLQWVFQGRDLMSYVAAAQVIRFGVFAAVVFAGVRSPADLWKLPIAEFAGVGACAAFTVAAYRRKIGMLGALLPASPKAEPLITSAPIGVSQIMWAIKYLSVTLLLGTVAPASEVGQFGAGLRIILAVHTFIAVYFYNLLAPVSRCTQHAPGQLPGLLRAGIRGCVWGCVFACVLGGLSMPWFIHQIYGPQYGRSSDVVQILLWMLAAALVSTHFRVALIAAGRQRAELATTTLGATLLLALMPVLYARWGLRGAAVAMTLAEVSTLALSWWFVQRQTPAGLRIWSSLGKPAVVGAVAILSIFASSEQPVWVRLSVAATLLVAGLVLLERRMIDQVRAALTPSRV